MRFCLLLAVPALALAGCQSAAEKHASETGEIEASNASMAEVSGLTRAAQKKHAMQPGLWETAMKVESSDFSMLPADQQAAQADALARQERAATKCAKASDLKTLDIENLEKVAGQCTFPHFVQKGGKLDVEISCTQNGVTTHVTQKGSMSATGYDVVVDQTAGTAGQPGYAAFRLHATGRRIGECPVRG